MKRIILAVCILGFYSTASAQDVDLLWKARALKASENLEKLEKEITKNDSMKLRLEIMVESAYTAIIAMSDVTKKETPIIVAYHIILNYGNDGLLDVVYIYDVKTYEYQGVRIDSIPKNRGILMMEGNKFSDFFVVANNIDNSEPMILFSKSNPFGTSVVESR